MLFQLLTGEITGMFVASVILSILRSSSLKRMAGLAAFAVALLLQAALALQAHSGADLAIFTVIPPMTNLGLLVLLAVFAVAIVADVDRIPVFLAAAAASLGALYADNLLAFIAFWECLTALLVASMNVKGGGEAGEAAFKMLFIALFSSVFLATGVLAAALYANPQNMFFSLTFSGLYSRYNDVGLVLPAALLFIGIGVETGLAPFYMWLADVYTGGESATVAVLSMAADTVGLTVLLRIAAFLSGAMAGVFLFLLVIISLATSAIGELSAFTQSRLRRILGYSAVADSGYVSLIGLLFRPSGDSYKGFLLSLMPAEYFILASCLSIGTAVLLLGVLEKDGIREIRDLAGVLTRPNITTAMLTIPLMSVSGIPPLAGFLGKFFVIMYAVGALAGLGNAGLAITVALLFLVCSAYIFRLFRVMGGKGGARPLPGLKCGVFLSMVLLDGLILALGLAPSFIIPSLEV